MRWFQKFDFRRAAGPALSSLLLISSINLLADAGTRKPGTKVGNTSSAGSELEEKCKGADVCFDARATSGVDEIKKLVWKRHALLRVIVNPIRFVNTFPLESSAGQEPLKSGSVPFIPPVPSAPSGAPADAEKKSDAAVGAKKAKGLNALGKDEVDVDFSALVVRWKNAETDVTKVTNAAQEARRAIEEAGDKANSFVKDSSDYSIQAILKRVSTLIDEIKPKLDTKWPDEQVSKAKETLKLIQGELDGLKTVHGKPAFFSWIQEGTHEAEYDSATKGVKALQDYLNSDLEKSRDAWRAARVKLVEVHERLIAAKTSDATYFIKEQRVDCGDGTPKIKKIKVTRTDLTVDNATPVTTEVTFECMSSVTLSTGIGFTNLDEREFSFVPAVREVPDPAMPGKTKMEVFQVIGQKNKSRFRPIPLLLANVAVPQLQTESVGLHFSFGAGVDLTKGSLGNDLEFLAGPSVRVFDKFFLTVGGMFGRVPELQSGFSLGDAVPSGLTEVPLKKSYHVGLGVSFTYRVLK